MGDNKGFSLVEIIIAMGIIAIVFTMFGVIIASSYRQHIDLGYQKANRENAVSGAEKCLSENSIMPTIGELKVSMSIPGEGTVEKDCVITRRKYNSNNDPSATTDNDRYLYIYAKS